MPGVGVLRAHDVPAQVLQPLKNRSGTSSMDISKKPGVDKKRLPCSPFGEILKLSEHDTCFHQDLFGPLNYQNNTRLHEAPRRDTHTHTVPVYKDKNYSNRSAFAHRSPFRETEICIEPHVFIVRETSAIKSALARRLLCCRNRSFVLPFLSSPLIASHHLYCTPKVYLRASLRRHMKSMCNRGSTFVLQTDITATKQRHHRQHTNNNSSRRMPPPSRTTVSSM